MTARQLCIAGVFSPNEGEEGQTVEFAVLEWKVLPQRDGPTASDELPHIRIHTFVTPRVPSRMRWGIVNEHGIDTKMLRAKFQDYPSEQDLLRENYLKGLDCVIFDANKPLVRELVADCASVEDLSVMWQQLFINCKEENVRAATTFDEMLECLHFPKVLPIAQISKHYTPLVLELYASAALWSALRFLRMHPERIEAVLAATQPLNGLWPVAEAPEVLFEGEHSELASFTRQELEDFFSRPAQDYIDWHRTCKYVNDWEYRRDVDAVMQPDSIPDGKEVVSYVFNRLFDLRMQLWVLIYYSVFAHKKEYALEIALAGGMSPKLSDSVKEDFSGFLANHLQDFLSSKQKQWLIRSVLVNLLKKRAEKGYEQYDFDVLMQEQRQDRTNLRYYLKQEPASSAVRYFYEVAAENGKQILFRRFLISGRGEERNQCVEGVNRYINAFMKEVKDPFSCFWTGTQTRNYVQCVTGVAWKDVIRPPRINESMRVKQVRALVSELILQESAGYIKALREHFVQIINRINEDDGRDFRDRFAFMGVSVEIEVTTRSQIPLFKRMFRLK